MIFDWLFPRGRMLFDLEAELHAQDRNGPKAEVEFKGWSKGRYILDIEVERYRDTLDLDWPLSVVIEGVKVGQITLDPRGRTRFRRTQADGPLGFEPALGQEVSLGQNGVIVISGRFERD